MWQEDRLRPGVQVQPGQHRETPSLKKERERERGREEGRRKKEKKRKRKKENGSRKRLLAETGKVISLREEVGLGRPVDPC